MPSMILRIALLAGVTAALPLTTAAVLPHWNDERSHLTTTTTTTGVLQVCEEQNWEGCDGIAFVEGVCNTFEIEQSALGSIAVPEGWTCTLFASNSDSDITNIDNAACDAHATTSLKLEYPGPVHLRALSKVSLVSPHVLPRWTSWSCTTRDVNTVWHGAAAAEARVLPGLQQQQQQPVQQQELFDEKGDLR